MDMTRYVDSNGDDHYELAVNADEQKEVTVSMTGDPGSEGAANGAANSGIDGSDVSDTKLLADVVVKDDKIYLEAEEVSIDITEDIKDGACEGTFELDGKTYHYEVIGTVEENTVNISSVE